MTRKRIVSVGARRSLLAVLGSGLAVAALAGCGSSQTSSATVPAASSSTAPQVSTAGEPCTGSQLAPSYAGTEGATGHLELTIALRNVSDRACLVRGYPAARLLDRHGQPLPLRVSRGNGFFPDTMSAPGSITLKPGASAHFGLSFVTNNEYAGAHVCRTAAAAASAAPGPAPQWRRVSLRSAPRISPCGDQLVVSPVHA
jgi:hypothetical protein